MKIYKVGNNLMYLSQKQVENLINKRDNYDINEAKAIGELAHGNVLDIGANIGYFTIIMAKSDKVKEVIAFEPDPTNYKNLIKNIQLNNIQDKIFSVVDGAVSDHYGTIDLYKCDFNDGMHRTYKSKWCTDKKIKVNTISIDDYFRYALYPINFVKIDVEGFEYRVLKGMKETLKIYHPTIVMEFHSPSIQECGDNPKDIYDYLIDSGYEHFDLLLSGYNDDDDDGQSSYHDDLTYDDLYQYTKNNVAVNVIVK